MSCIVTQERSIKMPYLDNTKCSKCFQDKKGNEEAEKDQFQVHAFFHSRHLKQIVDNQPVHRLTQSGFLISLLLLVNNHLELQNRSSKAEKAGGVLSSTLGALSLWMLILPCVVLLQNLLSSGRTESGHRMDYQGSPVYFGFKDLSLNFEQMYAVLSF